MMGLLLIAGGVGGLIAATGMSLYLYWELRWEVKYLEAEHIKLIQRALRAEAQLYESNTDREGNRISVC